MALNILFLAFCYVDFNLNLEKSINIFWRTTKINFWQLRELLSLWRLRHTWRFFPVGVNWGRFVDFCCSIEFVRSRRDYIKGRQISSKSFSFFFNIFSTFYSCYAFGASNIFFGLTWIFYGINLLSRIPMDLICIS